MLEARCSGKGVGSTQDPHPSLNLQVYFLTIDAWAAPNLGVLSGQKQGRSVEVPLYPLTHHMTELGQVFIFKNGPINLLVRESALLISSGAPFFLFLSFLWDYKYHLLSFFERMKIAFQSPCQKALETCPSESTCTCGWNSVLLCQLLNQELPKNLSFLPSPDTTSQGDFPLFLNFLVWKVNLWTMDLPKNWECVWWWLWKLLS